MVHGTWHMAASSPLPTPKPMVLVSPFVPCPCPQSTHVHVHMIGVQPNAQWLPNCQWQQPMAAANGQWQWPMAMAMAMMAAAGSGSGKQPAVSAPLLPQVLRLATCVYVKPTSDRHGSQTTAAPRPGSKGRLPDLQLAPDAGARSAKSTCKEHIYLACAGSTGLKEMRTPPSQSPALRSLALQSLSPSSTACYGSR